MNAEIPIKRPAWLVLENGNVVPDPTHTAASTPRQDTTMTEIRITQAVLVDPRTGSDKFYRVFSFARYWGTQYGRNGQIGTFTPVKTAADPSKAEAAARKKLETKLAKGYTIDRDGVVDVDRDPADLLADPTVIDELAAALPVATDDQTLAGTPAPVPVSMALDQPHGEDRTDTVIAALHEAGRSGPYAVIAPEPLRPMLASPITEAELDALLTDDNIVAQYKYDGDRIVVVVDEGEITVLNRAGQAKTRGVSSALLAPFTRLHRGKWVFDGELVDRTMVLFDMITAESKADATSWVGPGTPFDERFAVLDTVLSYIIEPTATIRDNGIVHVTAWTFRRFSGKLKALENARNERREGLILRDVNAPYEQARRSAALLKYKFTHTADLVVMSRAADKESVTLGAYDGDGELREVGSASTIGKGDVTQGAVWEVEFLYVVDPDHPRMVQPRLVRPRTDKSAQECLLDQFATAGTDKRA